MFGPKNLAQIETHRMDAAWSSETVEVVGFIDDRERLLPLYDSSKSEYKTLYNLQAPY